MPQVDDVQALFSRLELTPVVIEYESRFYRNFIFSREPFTEEEVSQLALLKYGCNYELMPEDLPEKYVLIYYVGDGDTMKLTYRSN